MSNILLVEDDFWQAELAQKALEKLGHEVWLAKDGLEAIELIDKWLPDVIVLDFFLPGPNGLTFLHELRSYSDSAHIPVIVFSAALKKSQTKELKPYGVVKILDKTEATVGELTQAVKEALK